MKKLAVLLVALGATLPVIAQRAPVDLSNNLQRRAHGFNEANGDYDYTRNHGTGLRVGASWAAVRALAKGSGVPASFELGAFHQRALSERVSWQIEGLYYRQTTVDTRTTGLRLPALLVFNPLDNISLHLGPQLQVRTSSRALDTNAEQPTVVSTTAAAGATSALTMGLVGGGEARVGFLRLGLRYTAPLRDLGDLPTLGRHTADAWRAGQVQVYVGAGF